MARKKTSIKPLKKQTFIIGEGITEQYYFNQLKREERLKVKINPQIPQHSDIDNIVKKANEFVKISQVNIAYCIIDLDRVLSNKKENEKYLKYKSKLKNSKQIFFFEVNPCFELWYLLHFNYSSKEYINCNTSERELKKYVNDYEKTEKYFINKNMYIFLKDKLPIAFSNSKKLIKDNTNTKCDIYKILEKLNINY